MLGTSPLTREADYSLIHLYFNLSARNCFFERNLDFCSIVSALCIVTRNTSLFSLPLEVEILVEFIKRLLLELLLCTVLASTLVLFLWVLITPELLLTLLMLPLLLPGHCPLIEAWVFAKDVGVFFFV